MTIQDMENVKALLESMEYVKNGEVYVHEDYTKSLRRLIETYKKQKHQAILTSREFKKCIERKEEMIDIMLEHLLTGVYYFSYDNLTKQDLYRKYETEAMARIIKRRKEKNGNL